MYTKFVSSIHARTHSHMESIIAILTFRADNNNITVADISGLNRPIPNPVRTFEEAFKHYRKSIYHHLSVIIKAAPYMLW